MTISVVLDADGLDALCEPRPSRKMHSLLREWRVRDWNIFVPAVVCAEACRGVPRTRCVEATLARHDPARSTRPAVNIVPTDFALARQVGAILHGAGADSSDMVDAHVVAVCAVHGGGMVITADSKDIRRLAQAVPSVRILTRSSR
ncbi:MAG: PIN domain-containing protein [Egibacteraceae bacterium]